jgi:HAD superfamily hydrolase (TIGR01549 family)
LQALGLDSFFSFVVTSQDVGVEKPNPQIYAAALGKARRDCPALKQLQASECLHVGDDKQR